jgi:uncharacterized protein YjbI with pentapeptide repeats
MPEDFLLNSDRTGFGDKLFSKMQRKELQSALLHLADKQCALSELGTIRGINFTDCDFTGVEFDSITFEHCNFDYAVFPDQLEDIALYSCDLPNAKFNGTTLSNVSFDRSVLSHAEFNNSSLYEVSFRACKLNEIKWHAAVIGESGFVHSNLAYSDFNQSKLQETSFTACDLYWTKFTQTVLRSCSITLCFMRSLQGLDSAKIVDTKIETSDFWSQSDNTPRSITISQDTDFTVNATRQADGTILVKIGCQEHSLDHWLKQGLFIADDNKVSEERKRRFAACFNLLCVLSEETSKNPDQKGGA